MTAPPPTFDLVVPLWNEERNLRQLVANIEDSGLLRQDLRRAILVDNGSTDGTGHLVDELASTRVWIRPEHLAHNCGYGGGIHHGMLCSEAPYVAYIPGDNQVSCEDLAKVWAALRADLAAEPGDPSPRLVKGWRHQRHDPRSMQIVSRIYTLLSNRLLGLGVRDVNALPKCFDRDLIDHLPPEPYRTFTIEPQLLITARRAGYRLIEVPVVFHARREGVSSWSGNRLKVYWRTFWQMFLLRREPGTTPNLLHRLGRHWAGTERPDERSAQGQFI